MFLSTENLFKETIKLYKNNFRIFFTYSFLSFIPPVISQICFILLYPLAWVSFSNQYRIIGYSLIIASILIAILSAIITTLLTFTIYRVIAKSYTNEKIGSFKREIMSTKKIFIISVITTTLTIIAVLGGMALLIIPGVIIAVYLSQAIFFSIIEEQSISDSLMNSTELVKGKWWRILWLTFISTLTVGFILYSLYFLHTFTMFIFNFDSGIFDTVLRFSFRPIQFIFAVSLIPLAYIAQIIIFIEAKKSSSR